MDASELRRKKRFKKRLGQAKWVLWAFIAGLILYYVHWRAEQVTTARIVSDEFLTRVGRGEFDMIQARLLTKGLMDELPERKFARQMSLLARKLGHLEEFDLVEDELSWDNQTVRIVYETTFSRATARAIFEIVPNERGIWKLDTFFFWADKWQEL